MGINSINLLKQASKHLQMGGKEYEPICTWQTRNGHSKRKPRWWPGHKGAGIEPRSPKLHPRLKVVCDAPVWAKRGYSSLGRINISMAWRHLGTGNLGKWYEVGRKDKSSCAGEKQGEKMDCSGTRSKEKGGGRPSIKWFKKLSRSLMTPSLQVQLRAPSLSGIWGRAEKSPLFR